MKGFRMVVRMVGKMVGCLALLKAESTVHWLAEQLVDAKVEVLVVVRVDLTEMSMVVMMAGKKVVHLALPKVE